MALGLGGQARHRDEERNSALVSDEQDMPVRQEQFTSASSRPGLPAGIFAFAAITLDAFLIVTVAALTGALYHATFYQAPGLNDLMIQIGALVAMFVIVPGLLRGDYAIASYLESRGQVGRLFIGWNIAFACATTFVFLNKTGTAFSRGSVLLFYLTGFLGLAVARKLLLRLTLIGSRKGMMQARRVFLVGTREDILRFAERRQPWSAGFKIDGVATLDIEGKLGRIPLDEQLDAAVRGARRSMPDDIFILVPWSREDVVDACVNALMTVPASIHLGPDRVLDRFVDARIQKVGPIASLALVRSPLTPIEVFAKRVFDFVVGGIALVLLMPVFGLIALAIKLDSRGPVLFAQQRYGFNQNPFRIYKFRSMTTLEDGASVTQATRGDARVTRVGRILRRFSLDELPQILNVIRGEMSLVGPRPHALAHDWHYNSRIALYARRLNVKPGITGWAQVNGYRGETDTEDKMRARVEHDLFYIDNWTLFFDLKILVLTVLSPKAHRNAF